ncbi:transposase family protein [Streptomyces sp. NBC_00322]|uniref:transposase family protein n=1 Tax=Streptomyces sp. NBC_00322 TaxID=2975712 RepID=UPI003FA74046
MPAAPSSPIPALLSQLASSRPATLEHLPGLLDALAQLPDPRRRQGRRHPLPFILALAACVVLAGSKSVTAIAEWAADAPDRVLLDCGAALRDPHHPYHPPSEATVRRVLQRLDGNALDRTLGAWLADRAYAGRADPPAVLPPRAAIAVDGKSLRRDPPRRPLRPPHLRAAIRRHRPGSAQGRRQDQRNHRVPPAAGPTRPRRRRG